MLFVFLLLSITRLPRSYTLLSVSSVISFLNFTVRYTCFLKRLVNRFICVLDRNTCAGYRRDKSDLLCNITSVLE